MKEELKRSIKAYQLRVQGCTELADSVLASRRRAHDTLEIYNAQIQALQATYALVADTEHNLKLMENEIDCLIKSAELLTKMVNHHSLSALGLLGLSMDALRTSAHECFSQIAIGDLANIEVIVRCQDDLDNACKQIVAAFGSDAGSILSLSLGLQKHS